MLVDHLAAKLALIACETAWESLTVDQQALYRRMARMAAYEVRRGSV